MIATVDRMLRKILVLALVISVLVTVLGLLYLYNKPKVPEELLGHLESDLVSHLSIGTSPVLIPSIIDRLIGYQDFRYQVKDVETIEDKTEASSSVRLCLKILVTYRVPERSSVYALDSPSEEFLYLAWRENGEWQVRKLAKSGVNNSLGEIDCSKWLDRQ